MKAVLGKKSPKYIWKALFSAFPCISCTTIKVKESKRRKDIKRDPTVTNIVLACKLDFVCMCVLSTFSLTNALHLVYVCQNIWQRKDQF